MKTKFTFLFCLFAGLLFAQETEQTQKKLPSVELKDLSGSVINTADMGFEGPHCD